MITLTYIYHDCFLLQTPKAAVLFDYFNEPPECDIFNPHPYLPGFSNIINKEKPLYILVSHHHKDHFNKIIFDFQKWHPNTKYIISKDVARFCRHILSTHSLYKGYKPTPQSVSVLSESQIFEDEILKIHAFGSTDIGNSYLLEIAGFKIFHAGDLNAWTWRDESTPEEVEVEIQRFRNVLDRILLVTKEIDIAMFPVDSRIGSGYSEGASIFLNSFNVNNFIPMHFCIGENEKELNQRKKDVILFKDSISCSSVVSLLFGAYSSISFPARPCTTKK